jgi:hypothetical protein
VGRRLACNARLVDNSTKRRLATLTIVGVSAGSFRVVRPWHMNWGASDDEAHGALAGDELMPGAGIVSTRVVEIQAPPSAVWPWLVQMGQGRGGAYTYDWIERRVGIDIHNVDRIIAELQNLAVGDEIEMPGYKMRVERLDRQRAMVLRSARRITSTFVHGRVPRPGQARPQRRSFPPLLDDDALTGRGTPSNHSRRVSGRLIPAKAATHARARPRAAS